MGVRKCCASGKSLNATFRYKIGMYFELLTLTNDKCTNLESKTKKIFHFMGDVAAYKGSDLKSDYKKRYRLRI